MGLLDAVNNSTPGGNIAKPLMIALGTLLVHKMFSGSNAAPLQPSATPEANSAAGTPDGGLLGGLGGLLNQLQASGHGDKVDSWVGSGQNKPIDPGQLGSALGQKTVSNAAQQAGVSEQELLSQLAQNLPGLVDKLTANGRLPTLQEVAAALTQPQR
ncbi:YidB family protein [Pseudorhodoplanes sinuspersici]|uniref:Uncharacterized protein n=1 Tax=Pseudorhodoplanes sinuspersici TaxID=1235591 RepID=A0A1W6ZP14_9HYPH|nr:YidB family protein [Pseudorhodoplanes sinuspersici]ARP98870.1 hypothetical protein CAK95_07105 [Pseudorhodoplanes sinuspersici]RKE69507.1 uncharacterized protein YidB (DUF937 family) [Pseudorhodoplanes sinuspersici]